MFQLLSTVVESGNEKIVIHIPIIISKVASVISENLPPCLEPWPQVFINITKEGCYRDFVFLLFQSFSKQHAIVMNS